MIGFASYVLADEDPHFFSLPYEGSEFHVDDEITFVTNDITNDWDEGIVVKLFNADDDTEVKEIGVFTGDDIYRPDDDDDWVFTWVVDEPEGNYYIRVYEQENDGSIDDSEDAWDEDVNRSFDFTVTGYQKKKRGHMKRSKEIKRKAQALKMAGF